jgi:twitching motility two-component system response regulator PilG
MLLARALEQGLSARAGPRRPDRAEPAAPARNSAAARPVLVVDDSLAVRAYLRSQLEARGIQIAEAQNVQEALNCVTRAAFACVLMDVLMPGVDGYEGCRQIKARLRGSANVPVIMLTSKASPFDRIRGKMAGCDAYLTKPIDPNQLHEVLARHVAMTTERAAAPANTSAAYGAPVAVRV